MTYARARLWLGISNVGTLVTLSVAALLTGLPYRLAADSGGEFSLVALFLVGIAVLSLPFDWLGGVVLPRRFDRPAPTTGAWMMRWLRGALIHTSVLLAIGGALLVAGRAFGFAGALVAFLLSSLVLVAFQKGIARFVARLPETPDPLLPSVAWVDTDDAAFTGGIAGLPGQHRVLLPSRWREVLPEDVIVAMVHRRRLAAISGARTAGILVALGWNAAGFVLASLVTGAAVSTAAGLIMLSLGFTLWSFVGLLVLPSLGRRSVFALDQLALRAGISHDALRCAIRRLDTLQDDEPQRGRWIETIFHPIPSVDERVRRLDECRPTFGAWHAARLALYTSWAGLGLLGRAVHCNVGRPSQWVYLPAD